MVSRISQTYNSFTFRNGTVGVASRFRVVFELKVDKPTNKVPNDIQQKVTNTAIEAIKKGVFSALKFDPASFKSYGKFAVITALNFYHACVAHDSVVVLLTRTTSNTSKFKGCGNHCKTDFHCLGKT